MQELKELGDRAVLLVSEPFNPAHPSLLQNFFPLSVNCETQLRIFHTMVPKVLRVVLLAACLLIGIVSATRFSDITKRKGYGPNAKKRSSSNNGGGGNSYTKFRFLTKETQRKYNSNRAIAEIQLLIPHSLPGHLSA